MTNGLYGYYDTKKQYVVYIGKDAHIDTDDRHKAHTNVEQYNKQKINKVIQNHPERYTYFKFIEGNYGRQTLNKLEKEAIRIFKTYKYDYPEKNVFNFTRGGDGFEGGKNSPNWREEDYKVVKAGISRGKQLYSITGRYSRVVKYSKNREKLEELTHKLNDKKITEKEIKNLGLYNIKYNIWDVSHCGYSKSTMFRDNGGNNPRKCFEYKYKGKIIPIGYFHDFVSCQIIDSIVQEEVKKCQLDN